MNALAQFHEMFGACPLLAILRGVTPGEAEAIGDALVDAGIRIIEVPLNSPEPFDSIAKLSARFAGRALIGAGTVLTTADVSRVSAAGGSLVVSPNSDRQVIAATVAAGMVSAPGFFTATEAFAALAAGAHALKLFPAEAASPLVIKALRAVLPAAVPLIVVGGVTPQSIPDYLAAGANGFGLGGGLYRPGDSGQDVRDRAIAYIEALR